MEDPLRPSEVSYFNKGTFGAFASGGLLRKESIQKLRSPKVLFDLNFSKRPPETIEDPQRTSIFRSPLEFSCQMTFFEISHCR